LTPKPVTQVLLAVKKPLQDSLTTDSGLKLYISPDYKKEWQASVTATITALPTKVNPREKKIFDQLSVGDEVCVSYRVVADFEFKGDGDRFMPVTEGDDRMRKFVNGRGDWIHVIALPGKISPIWVGYCQDKFRNIISGIEGSQSEVERWMAQFPYDKTDIYSFNNFFEYNGEDYWKCDLTDIFAKKVKGHLVAVGDRIICNPIDENVPKAFHNIQHHSSVKLRYQDRAKVFSGGKEKGIKRDDIVSFSPAHLEKYTFYGKNYYLINQNMVLGKWQEA